MNFVLILRYHHRNYCSFIFTTKVENLTTWPAGWPAHSTWAKASISNLQGGRHRFSWSSGLFCACSRFEWSGPGAVDHELHRRESRGPSGDGALAYYNIDARKWFTTPKIALDRDELTEEQEEAS